MQGSRFLREVEARRLQTCLLKVLSNRFGSSASADAAAAVQSVKDLQQLERLFDDLLAAVTLEEFRAALSAVDAHTT